MLRCLFMILSFLFYSLTFFELSSALRDNLCNEKDKNLKSILFDKESNVRSICIIIQIKDMLKYINSFINTFFILQVILL